MGSARSSCLFLVAGLLLVASPAMADDFRCGNQVVRKGMSAQEIVERCGRPGLEKTIETPVFARVQGGGTIQTGVQITLLWYYERGSNQYVARVTIRESSAEEIDILDVKKIELLREEHLSL